MEFWQRLERHLEEQRRAVPGGPQGWRPERLILRDWWHWRDQEFGFAHGRLALTGQNAGGKSSLLALTIPVLLDGRTEPARLDPAQSRDRFLHYYLLGADGAEAGNPDAFRYEARTGYIALEFYHTVEQRFLTIGMGVTASRSNPRRIVDWWGFLLLKGQRLGRDFDVRGADDTCLGRREFARLLGDGGIVVTEKSEYQRLVNDHLFGFQGDDFDALIAMLLQARRPKLGEQAGPDKVCDLLRRSLPGISPDRLSRVGEVVNNIEEYRRNLADVTAKAEAVGRVDAALYALAEVLVQEAAGQYLSVQGQLGHVVGKLKEARESLLDADEGLAALEEQRQKRDQEQAALKAEVEELRQSEGVDLQERLQEAKEKAAEAIRRVADLEERLAAERKRLEQVEGDQRRVAEDFAHRRRALADEIESLARAAEGLGWHGAARELREAGQAIVVLAVDDPPEVLEGAGPDPGLALEAEDLQRGFARAAEARRALDEADRAFAMAQTRIEELRKDFGRAADALEAAKDQADDAREDLIRQLSHWQEQSPALAPGDMDVARLAARVRDLDAPPAGGVHELVEPIAELAARRKEQFAARVDAAEQERRVAQLRVDRLKERLAEIEADPGDPPRSEVRARARRSLPDRLRPLFRWARFRPDVPPDVQARVEAAVLEAGWLDLLVFPEGDDGAGGAWAGAPVDARLQPRPVAGPSLLTVLEPEPDAPPAVAAALASIGWGEGSGDRWVAPDGRWRNGVAEGQVGPWVEGEAGYLGEENRRRRRERRLREVGEALRHVQDTLAQAEAERQAAEAAIQAVDAELKALQRLSWQRLFDALGTVRLRAEEAQRAQERVEAEKPKLAKAEAVLHDRTVAFHRAAADLPGAAELTYEGLVQRRHEFADLGRKIGALTAPAEALVRLAESYRSLVAHLQHGRQIMAGLERDHELARRNHAAAAAAVETLERQLADPDVRARQQRLERALSRLRDLEEEERASQKRRGGLETQRDTARERIAEYEPQEAELRRDLARRLEVVRERLRLHPLLAPHLQALDQEGSVNIMHRLARLVDAADLEEVKRQRLGELNQVVYAEQDTLRDYVPTWNREHTSLSFQYDRVPVTATQLRERLELRAREYAELMEEEQRKLYEDIIYEGILDELRRLIRAARDFTRRTNEKLKGLQLSDGEQLSLRLSMLPPDRMPGARIAHELEQMEQGSRWLDDEKRAVLLSTIKEEVERVREEARASGEEIGYQEAVARALDYRNWFEYELLSRMPGASAAVPIRTRGFGRRSTSAKAWALAVPVLAGVAARYDASPRSDLPRLVALDEAFAGFDTNNQENYLAFLSQLGFCWIITTPDELPYSQSLSAAMTYRLSLEGNLHTAFPILWNGSVAWEPLEALAPPADGGSEP